MEQKIFFKALSALLFFMYTAHAYSTVHHDKNYAVIKYPVIDLYGSATVPESVIPAATRNYAFCARIHQALFNECFQVVETSGDMVALSIPWAIYGYDDVGKPQCRYWAERKNLVMLDTISNHHTLQESIPHYAHKKNSITLKMPYTDTTGITYSVGTQFVCTHHQPDQKAFQVVYLDTQKISLRTMFVPHACAYKQNKQSLHQSRQQFVQLLTEFIGETAQQEDYNTVPYVWGGGSFTKPYSENFNEDRNGFHRAERETVPLSGYDCSLLVLRFARMAQLPYTFKTTAMLEKYGKKFTPKDTLQEGDLIWLQGHVVVITDLQNCLVTEAVGYENFYGKLQTLHLSELLKDINSWDDLLHAYYSNRSVMRLDKYGDDFKQSPVKIFKLF